LQSETISPAVLANKFLASPYKVRRDVIAQTLKKREDIAASELSGKTRPFTRQLIWTEKKQPES